MDAALVGVALAGALCGLVASTLPGIHVNLLAVAILAWASDTGAAGAAFLVAALAASPFGLALSSVFFAGPSDESALASLPAQALAREGRAAEAVALQAWGALLGILLALPLALVLRAALVPASAWLARAMPWIILLVIAALVLSEKRRLPIHARWLVVPWGARERHVAPGDPRVLDPHGLVQEPGVYRVERAWREGPLSGAAGKLAALCVLVLAGALGLAAFRLGAASPFGLPASPLLPLLAGLFALPTLVSSLRASERARARLRAPRVLLRELLVGAAPGAAAGATLGLVPGVSNSHAALLAPEARTPERALVRLAAVAGAGVVFTLLAWHALAKPRSGALVAAEQLAPPAAWPTWAPPPAVLAEAALVVAAALAACLAARALSRPMARVPPRPLAWGGLALLILSVAAFNGALGLAVLATGALVGAVPMRIGVRRSHAMGAILVPALLRAWGLA